MSWKLHVSAMVVLTILASSSIVSGRDGRSQIAGPQKGAAMMVAGNASPTAAAKQTDNELIAQQKTCPVTDQPLGSMGKPVKVVVKNRTVFLCCAGCKKKLLADPNKYLKKLDGQNGQKK